MSIMSLHLSYFVGPFSANRFRELGLRFRVRVVHVHRVMHRVRLELKLSVRVIMHSTFRGERKSIYLFWRLKRFCFGDWV
jgi:hypothetical protein